jgi:hypothetical protein
MFSIDIKLYDKIKAHANLYLKKYAAYRWRRRTIRGATWRWLNIRAACMGDLSQ